MAKTYFRYFTVTGPRLPWDVSAHFGSNGNSYILSVAHILATYMDTLAQETSGHSVMAEGRKASFPREAL